MAAKAQHFALTVVEAEGKRYDPGDVVPGGLPGLDDLIDAGAVGDEPPADEDDEA